MEKVRILVIGAGAVGLAIGRALSRDIGDVVVVERENSFGRHTSSRNSEVIHSGIYYPQDTLKAGLCIEGNERLYAYLAEKGIPYQRCGKLVVAVSEDELPKLRELHQNGLRNGVKGLEILDAAGCAKLEPQVKAIQGLWVPSTGIFDTHTFMKTMVADIEDAGGFVVYDMRAETVRRQDGGYVVGFSDGEEYFTEYLINSGGLFCEEVARAAGIDTVSEGLRIHWCKAEYYKTTKIHGIRHLVYPIPDPKGVFLGIHLTINLNGDVRFGPNAYYVDKLDYGMDESWRDDFYRAVSQYLPVEKEHLMPDDTGIRPKLQGPGEGFRDFYIREESARGLPRFINLMGIESPGLTSSLAIGEMVRSMTGL